MGRGGGRREPLLPTIAGDASALVPNWRELATALEERTAQRLALQRSPVAPADEPARFYVLSLVGGETSSFTPSVTEALRRIAAWEPRPYRGPTRPVDRFLYDLGTGAADEAVLIDVDVQHVLLSLGATPAPFPTRFEMKARELKACLDDAEVDRITAAIAAAEAAVGRYRRFLLRIRAHALSPVELARYEDYSEMGTYFGWLMAQAPRHCELTALDLAQDPQHARLSRVELRAVVDGVAHTYRA